jgi:hypothetical protein
MPAPTEKRTIAARPEATTSAKFGYGSLLAGIAVPYLIDKLLGPMFALIVTIILFLAAIALLLAAHEFQRLSTKARIGILVLIVAVLVSMYFPGNRIRREQKITATEGNLSNCTFLMFGCGEPGPRMLQLGDSGGTLIYGGSADEPMMQLAYDAGIQVDNGQKGPELTTTVRDKDGKIVVHIEKNHWVLFPPFYSDKNYTRDALEVKDGRGHVVLWTRLLKDRVQIQGEWRDEFGHGRRWRRCPKPRDACIDLWDNPQEELANEHLIEPMFEYPSKDHLGEARRVWPLHD